MGVGTLAGYKLTARNGARVERESFDDLDEAIAALEVKAKEIRAAGPLRPQSFVRDYEPGDQVAGRVEISTGGILRGRSAGVDVMGDGSLVPFAGGVSREPLEPRRDDGPYEAVKRALDATD